MKTPLLLLPCLVALVWSGAAVAADSAEAPLPPEAVEQLVSPIALYPDPLVALILPAATHPADVVLAARFLNTGGSPENVLAEPWDESVKALTRYREVVEYLDRNLEWTRRLGDCFIDQPDDVMDAIQAVRARARGAGMLIDTPQQEVVVASDEICILPTNPTVIYVPRYDPLPLCGPVVTTYYPNAWLTFGIAYNVGPWLSYDCDWRARHVRIAHRPPAWYYQPDWRRHHFAADVAWTRWAPGPRHDRFDRHDFDPVRRPNDDRRWIGAGQTVWSAPRSHDAERDREHGDRRRAPQQPEFERERYGRPDFAGRPRRDDASPVATAPSVVATSPSVPTAPALASQRPGSFATGQPPRFSEHHRAPRPDDSAPRVDRAPRADSRPGWTPPPMVNPAPMTASPVGPAVQPPTTPRGFDPDQRPPRDEPRNRSDRSERDGRDRRHEN